MKASVTSSGMEIPVQILMARHAIGLDVIAQEIAGCRVNRRTVKSRYHKREYEDSPAELQEMHGELVRAHQVVKL